MEWIAKTAWDQKRVTEMERFDQKKDPGAYGRQFELMCAAPLSRKTRVSKQGEKDVFVRVDGRYVKAECKTTGGRVQSMLTRENKSKLVIYELHHRILRKPDKTHDSEWYVVHSAPAVICTMEQFVNCLLDCGAVKNTNGKHNELAIQPSNKSLWLRLLAWPIKFDREREYSMADFEGLVL